MRATNDEQYMARALALAKQARDLQEVPVGAVVVRDDKIIGEGFNQTIALPDPSAHAEILALRDAAKTIGNHRLTGASLYVTLEPCIMCAGAMLHARIARLIYATPDEKFGAAGSALNLLESPFLNHTCTITAGINAQHAGELLKEFFAVRRGRRHQSK